MAQTEQTVIGYVRVSTQEQGRSGLGLEAQRRSIRRACREHGWALLRVEEDVQSGKSRRRRPGLQRAIAACSSGEVRGIVAAKLDRLSRSVVDCGALLDEAKGGGWNLVALDFGLDLSTPQGRLVANVLASVAQWEREVIGQRVSEAHAVTRSRGGRLGRPSGIPPKVRARIRRQRRAGRPLRAIADGLNRSGVPTVLGGKRWYASTVRAALTRS